MNNGIELEKFVQRVYSLLLNMKDEGIIVGHNVKLVDKDHIEHQTDVYYQFERAGIVHKVAIECKDHARRVENGDVAKFSRKMSRVGSIQKVMVSKSGYQASAKKMAEADDILILTIDELPKLNELLAKRLETVALPDEKAVGEPFWTIMEKVKGSVTGSFFASEHPVTQKPNLLLFYSKDHADKAFEDAQLDHTKWCVRGMPQYVFKTFLSMLKISEEKGNGVSILFLPPGALEEAEPIWLPATREILMKEYYNY